MKNNTLATLLLSVFIALLGIGIIVPVMPVFASELGAGGFALGMIIAAFSISRGLLQPIVGNLSDKWGRKNFLIAGLFIYGIVGLLIPQATNVGNLIAIRAFHGVGSAMIVPIAMAYVGLLSPVGHEGRYMSYLNIAIFCGIGCGPVIGGLVSDLFGFASVFYLMAVLSFIALILVISNMPKRSPTEIKEGSTLLKSMKKMVGNSRTAGILLARYATMIIMVPTMAFLPLLMSNWPVHTGLQVGMVIACRTLTNAVLQVPFGKFADKYNKLVLLLAGVLCMSLAVLAIPSMENVVSMTILYIFLGIGEAVIWPVLGAYATEEGRVHYGQGTMMGMFSFTMSGGVLTGAVLAGISMDLVGIAWAYYTCGAMVLLLTLVAAKMIFIGEKKATAARS
ncbi:MAG: quinolone resistance protein [Desulfobulbaceae bacterium S3730MH12]|nr:MAG: quinolone resistance protein [Desulfobulbaceae bacterium S3730MH12]